MDAAVVTSSSISLLSSSSSSSSSDPIAATIFKDVFFDFLLLCFFVVSPNSTFFSSLHVFGGPFNGCAHVNRPKKFAAPKNISFVSVDSDNPQSFTSLSYSTAF